MQFDNYIINTFSRERGPHVQYGWCDLDGTNPYLSNKSCHGESLLLRYNLALSSQNNRADRPRFVSYLPHMGKDRKNYMAFWEWLFSDKSPYSSVIKDFEWILDSKEQRIGWSIVPPEDENASVFMGLCMASRMPYHISLNVDLWNHLTKLGWNPTIAFIVCQQTGIEGECIKPYYASEGNAPLDYFSIAVVRNMLKKEPTYSKYKIKDGAYDYVTMCWGGLNFNAYKNLNKLLAEKYFQNQKSTSDGYHFKKAREMKISQLKNNATLPVNMTVEKYVETVKTFLKENDIDCRC